MSKKKNIKERIHKLEKGFAVLLSLWGVGNAVYWEFYMDYPISGFCLWHRYLYITLSLLTVLLISSPKAIIRKLTLLIVSLEFMIILDHIYPLWCFDSICKIISMDYEIISITDRINFIVTLLVLIVLSFIEILIAQKQKSLRVLDDNYLCRFRGRKRQL